MAKNPHAAALGKRGGKVKSDAKAAAARANGKLGGRPLKVKLMKSLILVAALLVVTPATAADKSDPRLAAAGKAFVQPLDALTDDQPVASCLADRLANTTPLELVKSPEAADIVLTIGKASTGKHPKADIVATLPDGTVLWEGGTKTRGFNLIGRDMTCVLADDMLSNLRKAMRQAREVR